MGWPTTRRSWTRDDSPGEARGSESEGRGVTLRDLSGIFSRYFLAGFFLPALAAVLLVGVLAGIDVPTGGGRDAGLVGGIVVLFALGVVGGLVLLGLRR